MKRTLTAVSVCAVLSGTPLYAFAHDDGGGAFLGGFLGGIVGSAIVGRPAYRIYEPAPVVVEEYAPAPVVIVRPRYVVRSPAVIHYGDRGRRWHDQRWYRHHRHHHDDD